jgi:hypothetical protein
VTPNRGCPAYGGNLIRGVQGLGWIIVINLIPTGVGWLAALIGALMLPRGEPAPSPRVGNRCT